MNGIDVSVFITFGEALAIGLLFGLERYKDRKEGEKKSAGLRTFAVISVLGAVCGFVAVNNLTLVTFGALAGFLLIGYFRRSETSPGITTETAALLTFWLGYLMHTHQNLSISIGIVVVILLAAKRTMHDFVREQISEGELYDTLKFLAVVFIVLPLLPNTTFGPLEVFNPRQLWGLVVLVSTVSFGGYVLMRLVGPRRGLALNALFSGLVSTTALTISLAHQSRRARSLSRPIGLSGILGNAVQFPRLLLLLSVVSQQMALSLLIPFLGAFAAGILFYGAFTRKGCADYDDQPAVSLLENPYSFRPALKFALLVSAVLFLVKIVKESAGETGVYLAAALSGFANVSAVALSLGSFVQVGEIDLSAGCLSLFLAVVTNLISKTALAWLNGSAEFFSWLVAGLTVLLSSGAVLLYFGFAF